jgi:hypothetical protein
MKKTHLLGMLLLLGVTSCDTDVEPIVQPGGTTPVEVTKEGIVGTYFVSKVELRKDGGRSDVTNNWFSSYAGDCAKDDVTVFNPDESFVVLDGTIACDESTDDTGTWKLLSKAQLKIDSDTAAIEELTATTLRIISPVYSSSQGDLIFTYTRK